MENKIYIDCSSYSSNDYPLLHTGFYVKLFNGTHGRIEKTDGYYFYLKKQKFHVMDIKAYSIIENLRKIAMKWWNNIDQYDPFLNLHGRTPSSLTGREIENIYLRIQKNEFENTPQEQIKKDFIISDNEITIALNEAYKKCGLNAYFSNGFREGVKFVLDYINSNKNN